MTFSQTLAALVSETQSRGKQQLDESLQAFAGSVAEALTEDWGKFELSSLTADADQAGEAAIWLDAVACAKKFGLAKKCALADIPVERLTPVEVGAALSSLVEKKKLPAKGLVIVAWTPSPSDELSGLEFSYVGFSGSHRKLEFKGKSPLAKALGEAKFVTAIVPEKAKPSDLEALASSIIHLARAATDEDPTFNDDVDAAMDDSAAWKKLDQLSDLLEQAGVHLNNRARSGED